MVLRHEKAAALVGDGLSKEKRIEG